MSERIQQTIEVLVIVKRGRPESPTDVERLVADGSNQVAISRSVEVSTVTAKFRRPTELGFTGTDDFRRAVSSWLFNGSTELEDVMRSSAKDHDDHAAIRQLFVSAVLSYELVHERSGWRLHTRYGDGRLTTRPVRSLSAGAQLLIDDDAT